MNKLYRSCISLILVILLANTLEINGYTLDNKECANSVHQQSPIDVVTSETKYHENRYFRLLNSNYTDINTIWKVFPDEKAVGFGGIDEELGYILFVKDWSIYKFDLDRVLFRVRSSHTFDKTFFDVEMEIVHKLDDRYKTKGRYIHPTANTLIYSVFFRREKDVHMDEAAPIINSNFTEVEEDDKFTREFPKTTKMFDHMALTGFWRKITQQNSTDKFNITQEFNQDLHLHKIVTSQPSYFYEGSTTSGKCEKVWRVLSTKYQVITEDDYQKLLEILSWDHGLGFINRNELYNSRNQQTVVGQVWRNDEPKRMMREAHTQQYKISSFLKVYFLIMLLTAAFFLEF